MTALFKNTLLAVSVLLLTVSACSKTDSPVCPEPAPVPAPSPGTVAVTVGITSEGRILTRAEQAVMPPELLVASPSEKKINEAYVLVYDVIVPKENESPFIFRDCRTCNPAVDGGRVTFNLPLGKEFALTAGANTGVENPTQTLQQFEVFLNTLSIIDDESDGNFRMFGMEGIQTSASTTAVTIKLERSVAKFLLGTVRYEPDYAAAPASITINRVMIINAVRNTSVKVTLSGNEDHSVPVVGWYNKVIGDPVPEHPLLNPVNPLWNQSISKLGSADFTERVKLYCYPNYESNDLTRVVIEADFDGKTCYYPVEIPKVEPNRLYYITDVVIHGIGVDDPHKKWERTEGFESVVIASDWTSGGVLTPNF